MHGVPGAYAPGSAETGPSGLGASFGCCDQVLTHLALLRSALQAWGVPLRPYVGLGGLVSVVQLTCCCDSGLKGRLVVALFTNT